MWSVIRVTASSMRELQNWLVQLAGTGDDGLCVSSCFKVILAKAVLQSRANASVEEDVVAGAGVQGAVHVGSTSYGGETPERNRLDPNLKI